jgi:hypothetical protein
VEVIMICRREILVGVVGALLLVSATGAALAQATAAKAPAATAATPPKFVTPFKGEGQVQILNPQASREGNMVVTRIKVKNVSKGPLVGFKVDEYWYSAKGETISGSPTFRHLKPFMPNDVIDVLLRSPWNDQMATGRSLRQFAHQNGSIKATVVPKFKD